MQTVDDKRRWFAGNARKARAIAFTTRRMTAKARWNLGARTDLGKLLASQRLDAGSLRTCYCVPAKR